MAKSAETKRSEAEKRQALYNAAPAFDKLAAISERPGESARERERILRAALA